MLVFCLNVWKVCKKDELIYLKIHQSKEQESWAGGNWYWRKTERAGTSLEVGIKSLLIAWKQEMKQKA